MNSKELYRQYEKTRIEYNKIYRDYIYLKEEFKNPNIINIGVEIWWEEYEEPRDRYIIQGDILYYRKLLKEKAQALRQLKNSIKEYHRQNTLKQ